MYNLYNGKQAQNMGENLFIIAIQFATKEQLKDLTHIFCFWIPCYKLYKEGVFSYVFTLKYMCHFEMNSKNLNLKAKH